MEGAREIASFDDFYKSFPKDEVLKWKFFEKEVVPYNREVKWWAIIKFKIENSVGPP